MKGRTLFEAAVWLLAAVFLALSMRGHFLDFQAFQALNPGSGIMGYLLSVSPFFWPGVLVAIGVGGLRIWWNRLASDADREDQDDESKRLFREARGD